MPHKFKITLGIKFALIIIIMSLSVSFLVVYSAYQLYNNQIENIYSVQGESMANAVEHIVSPDEFTQYAAGLTADEAYEETLRELRLCAQSGDATYVYLLAFEGDDVIFLFDTDATEEQFLLGDRVPAETEFGEYLDEALQQKTIGPAYFNEEAWGHILSFYRPYYDASGAFAGYIGIDFNIDDLAYEQTDFITQLAIAALGIAIIMTVIFIIALRKLVISPINKTADAASNYLFDTSASISKENSITELNIQTGDELEQLAGSLKTMEQQIKDYLSNLEKVRRSAETDSMTEILNRETFITRVEYLLTHDVSGGYYVYMMLDIDHFKEINDTFGHDVGDKVLIACSAAIKSCFRPTDLIARLGGDEIAVFYKSRASIEEVAKRAECVKNAVNALDTIKDYTITMSIGIAACPAKQDISYEDLYLTADEALYQVKENGRNNYAINFRDEANQGEQQ